MLNTNDWFTTQFATDKSILLADEDWLYKLYGVKTGAAFSLRLITDLVADEHLPVLIVRHDNLTVLDGATEAMKALRAELKTISSNLPIIVVPATPCDLEEARFGLHAVGYGTRIRSAFELAANFSWAYPALVADPGATKKINRDVRDAFQLFTRAYLTKDRTIQDFDMLRKVDGKFQPVELKRFNVSVDNWKPYCNDSNNFKAMLQASKKLNLGEPICVGYCKHGGDRVTVHRIKSANYSKIEGLREEVEVAQIWQARPEREYVSANRLH